MRERTVSKEVKKMLRDSIIFLTVTYASEIWLWNKCRGLRFKQLKLSYLRGGCGVNRMDGESNDMYT